MSARILEPHPGRARSDDLGAFRGEEPRREGFESAALRVPTFWKIFFANVVLIGAAAWAGTTVAGADAGSGRLTVAILLTGVALLLLALTVNAVLIRAALSPLDGLERAARRVGGGDLSARAPESSMADRGFLRLVGVFNRMLDSLSVGRHRQRELARQVLASEERERERIAQELYGGTAQTLAGVLVRLRIAEGQLPGSERALAEIRSEVVLALEEIRALARRLRPPELDELGVRSALEAHARALVEKRPTEVRVHGHVPSLSSEVAVALFRVAQEAITNALTHGAPDNVEVRLASEGDWVEATITDDGVGFVLATALAKPGLSPGLHGMHERAGYLDGRLSIESGPGLGTRVTIRIPMSIDTPTHPSDEDGVADRLVDGVLGMTVPTSHHS